MSAAVVDIEFTQSAYRLDHADGQWLQTLAGHANQIIGKGYGVMALHFCRNESGQVALGRIEAVDCDPELVERRRRFTANLPPEMTPRLFRPGVGTFRRATAGLANADALFSQAYGTTGMRDALAAVAVDPNGLGVLLIAGLPEVTSLSTAVNERLWRLTVHLAAGARLRRELAVAPAQSALPLGAEALLDPKGAKLTEASAQAATSGARERLREAVKAMERARGPSGRRDPAQAMAIWRGLVDGRWSLVDWFDSDGRRFIVARKNAPSGHDARGLSRREQQVVAFAALGESDKAIGYRLGLPARTICRTLDLAKRKLGVASRTELIRKLGPLVP